VDSLRVAQKRYFSNNSNEISGCMQFNSVLQLATDLVIHLMQILSVLKYLL
jgi:hypothetical protein